MSNCARRRITRNPIPFHLILSVSLVPAGGLCREEYRSLSKTSLDLTRLFHGRGPCSPPHGQEKDRNSCDAGGISRCDRLPAQPAGPPTTRNKALNTL